MTDRQRIAKLLNTANIASGNPWRTCFFQIFQLSCLQLVRHLGLQDVVDTSRPAAQVWFKRLAHLKPGKPQQLHRQIMDRLAMLQGAGRMIRHRTAPAFGVLDDCFQRQFSQILGNIAGHS